MPEGSNENTIQAIGSNAKCENCGGNVTFDPKSGHLKCPNCDSEFSFTKNQTQVKHEIKDGKISSNHDEWAKETKIVKCQTCGAEILLTGLEMSHACPYCGSDYVVDTDILPGNKPDVVVPFSYNQKDAGEVFLKGIKKKFFAPKALKKKLPDSKIRGIYVPAFTFDADTVSKYSGLLQEDRSYTDSKGNRHVRIVDIPISGIKECEHRDYVIESSTKLNGKQMNALLPYKFSESYAFDPNFVRGFNVEHYADSLEKCYTAAQKGMEERIKQIILSSYHYDRVVSFSMSTNYSNEFYSYRMLPVYTLEFNFKNKQYLVYMNGQTGKIGTGYPKDKLKIFLTVLFIILGIAAVILLVYFYVFYNN